MPDKDLKKPAAKAPASKTPALRKVVAKKAVAAKVPAKKVPAKKAPAVKAAASKPAKPVKAPKPEKLEKAKIKLVRDSFTMPQEDWALIAQLKERALGFKHTVKKSELLRAGLQALAGLSPELLQARLTQLTPLKPGRPKAQAKSEPKPDKK